MEYKYIHQLISNREILLGFDAPIPIKEYRTAALFLIAIHIDDFSVFHRNFSTIMPRADVTKCVDAFPHESVSFSNNLCLGYQGG